MKQFMINQHYLIKLVGLIVVIALTTNSALAELSTTMVKDINPGSGDSYPREFTEMAGKVFFQANDGTNGHELWMTDRTAAGTMMVKDINPGSGGSGSGDWYLTEMGGKLFFKANDGTNGHELWMSDGTAAGTMMVKDINPGSGGSYPLSDTNPTRHFTEVGGKLFFSADDGTNGSELWMSDGTATGTVMVKDINPGPGDSRGGMSYRYLTEMDGILFFGANDGTHGSELWMSDGTAAGTMMVKDLNPGSGSTYLRHFTEMGGKLFFTANDGIWMSDGTAAGTVIVKDIDPGSGWKRPSYLTKVGGKLFFWAIVDGEIGETWEEEVWMSDGTAAGTVMVKNLTSNSGFSSPWYFTEVGGKAFFRGYDGTYGQELWMSDGTATGTVMVKDIYPGSGDSYPYRLTEMGGKLFFGADDGTNGSELWMSDGTAAGTVMVKDISSGFTSPSYFTEVSGNLFFWADDGTYGRELWITQIYSVFSTSVNIPANEPVEINANSVDTVLEITTSQAVQGSIDITKTSSNPSGTSSLSVPSLDTFLEFDISEDIEDNITSMVIRYYYTDEEVTNAGLNENSLGFYWWNETLSSWEMIDESMDWVYGTGVNTVDNYVWANVSHSSIYALVELPQVELPWFNAKLIKSKLSPEWRHGSAGLPNSLTAKVRVEGLDLVCRMDYEVANRSGSIVDTFSSEEIPCAVGDHEIITPWTTPSIPGAYSINGTLYYGIASGNRQSNYKKIRHIGLV